MIDKENVAGLCGAGGGKVDAPDQSAVTYYDTPRGAPSSTWHSAELDRIADEMDSIIEGLRPLWRAARAGGAATRVVAFGLREICALRWRQQCIQREAGL